MGMYYYCCCCCCCCWYRVNSSPALSIDSPWCSGINSSPVLSIDSPWYTRQLAIILDQQEEKISTAKHRKKHRNTNPHTHDERLREKWWHQRQRKLLKRYIQFEVFPKLISVTRKKTNKSNKITLLNVRTSYEMQALITCGTASGRRCSPPSTAAAAAASLNTLHAYACTYTSCSSESLSSFDSLPARSAVFAPELTVCCRRTSREGDKKNRRSGLITIRDTALTKIGSC